MPSADEYGVAAAELLERRDDEAIGDYGLLVPGVLVRRSMGDAEAGAPQLRVQAAAPWIVVVGENRLCAGRCVSASHFWSDHCKVSR
jgi:hypothetical protein